jgi:ATP-dependent RNA helicase SUPV3L1/SUV3
MRKHGVRFGAYHVFMPALIKPAPAELITLLWALKNDGLDKPGYGDLIRMLAAGRTSIVTEPGFERNFYKLAGFRFLGKRAVRIDILERLADLIRPRCNGSPAAASVRKAPMTGGVSSPRRPCCRSSARRSMTLRKSSRASVTGPTK